MQEFAYYNEILSTDNISVSINDRGFLYGHSVYESIAMFDRCLFKFESHLERLQDGLNELNIPFDINPKEIQHIIEQLWDLNQFNHQAKCYIQITAGDTQSRNYINFNKPNVLIRLYEWPEKEIHNHKAVLTEDKRWSMCHVKSNSLAYNAISGHYAHQSDAIEVIFTSNECIQECSTSNIFIVKNNTLLTPSVDHQLLNGVTRQWVIDQAKEAMIDVHETTIHTTDLLNADEIFITASFKGVHPITQIDQYVINHGMIGPVTTLLKKYYINAISQCKVNSNIQTKTKQLSEENYQHANAESHQD